MTPTIRPATPDDAAGCLAIYRPFVESTAVSFETEVPDEAAFRARMAEVLARYPWLVCETEDGVAGYAYATGYRPRAAYQWSVETTVYLAESARGRGLGGALYERLLPTLRAYGYVNAYAVITLPNPQSVALHERMGYRHTGTLAGVGYKLGRWHDVGTWHVRVQAPPRQPRPPGPPPAAS